MAFNMRKQTEAELLQLLLKCNTSQPLTNSEKFKFRNFTNNLVESVRDVCYPVTAYDTPKTLVEFVNKGNSHKKYKFRPFTVMKDQNVGLAQLGFVKYPGAPVLREGDFGKIQLLKFLKQGHAMDYPRVAALNTRKLDEVSCKFIWTESCAMKSVKHENVLDVYSEFVVEKKNPDQASDYTYCMIMEYANAGDLATEIDRYPGRYIPETGARFYIRQIMSGLKCLLLKKIVHRNLHVHSVLMSYRSNGKHKRCKISDFNSAHFPNEFGFDPEGAKKDCQSVYEILMTMLCGHSDDGLTYRDPKTRPHMTPMLMWLIEPIQRSSLMEMYGLQWFQLPTIAPDPSDPPESTLR